MSRTTCGALGIGLWLAACGGHPASPDASGPCWPLDATPGGMVEAGTGDITFESMPAMIPIVQNGTQSDPYFQIHARMHGMPPGDPTNVLAPGNPRTRVSATIDALGLNLGVDCPASLGYVASTQAGAFDLVHSIRVGLRTLPIDQAAGQQVHITVELVGANGLYAKDMKDVTLMISPGP